MIYRDQRALEVFYFGDGKDPRITGPKCNACGVDIGPWYGKKELHIAFHEQLKATPPIDAPANNDGIWTMTDSELQRELAKAWHRGQRAAIVWQHKHDRGEHPEDPVCPFLSSDPHTWDKDES